MPDMGLPLAYGAGTAADELARLVKERLLIQEQQRRQAALEWQRQYQGGMLDLGQDRNAIAREEMATQVPERQARVRGLTASAAKTEQDTSLAAQDAAEEQALAKDPVLGPILRARKAGAAPIDTQLGEKTKAQQELERLRQRGDISVANIRADAMMTGRGAFSDPQELQAIDRLAQRYTADPTVKAANEMRRQLTLMRGAYQRIASGQSRDLNADSQAILVTFQKILDPTSVVRESEYARSGQNQALMDRMLGAATKLAKGGAGVTPAALKNFLDSAEAMYAGVKQYRSRIRDRISRTAQRYGLPEDEIFPDEVETDEAPGGPAVGYANPATVRRK